MPPTSPRKPVAVIGLGGNALAPAGESPTVYDQFRHARQSLGPIVELVRSGWDVCVVHGNGPQVGDELVRNEIARDEASPLPLGVLVAATAGWIGYMIQQSLENALMRAGITRQVATVITQVEVDPSDPAMRKPTKFIGRPVSPERAAEIEAEGHIVKKDGHGNLRRVVGSPPPKSICELPVIKALMDAGIVAVACGGGGAPVYRHPTLGWEGIDAVYADWGTANQRALSHLTLDDAVEMDRNKAFGEGSMAPKVRAAIDFVRRTKGRAIITSLECGQLAVRGEAGTTITATETA